MKIELNVEGSQLDSEVKDILSTLTPEQKQEMAKQVLVDYFKNYDNSLDNAWIQKTAVNEFRTELEKRKDSYDYSNYYRLTDQQLIDTRYEVRNIIDRIKKQKRDFVCEILKESVEMARAEIKAMVEADEQIKKVKDEVLAEVKNSFAQLVKDSMLNYFSNQMSELFSSIHTNTSRNDYQSGTLQQIEERLNRNNIY